MRNFLKNINTHALIRVFQIINLVCISSFVVGVILYIISATYDNPSKFDAKGYLQDIDVTNRVLSSYTGRKVTYRTLLDSFSLSSVKFYATSFIAKDPSHVVTADDSVTIKFLKLSDDQKEKVNKLQDKHYKSDSSLKNELNGILGKDFTGIYTPYRYLTEINTTGVISSIAAWFAATILIALICFPVIALLREQERQKQTGARIERAQEEISNNPGKVLPTWDMAQITLEQYFRRNLSQINMIFVVSIFVMLAGFILIAIGILLAYGPQAQDRTLITTVSTASGIFTEFIGATFIFIYNSTIKQAINYSRSLEKINSVGMSIKILDSISVESSTAEKLNQAKIDIAKLLIEQSQVKPQDP